MSDAPDVTLLERLEGLDAFFAKHGVLLSGFTGFDVPVTGRTFFWSEKGVRILELSYDEVMKHHPLELLDLADAALTKSRTSH